jgi:ribonuclease P protein component
MKACSFTKKERLLKHSQFIRKSPARKKAFPHFLVIMKPNSAGITRLGLAVGKSSGGSVQRNRIKRLLREFFRRSKSRLPRSQDIIIVALKGSEPLTYRQVFEELKSLLI